MDKKTFSYAIFTKVVESGTVEVTYYNVALSLNDEHVNFLETPSSLEFEVKEKTVISIDSNNVLHLNNAANTTIQLVVDEGYMLSQTKFTVMDNIDIAISTKPIEYTISFLPGEYKFDPIADMPCVYDQSFELPMPSFIDTIIDEENEKIYTYSFLGWNDDADNVYEANSEVSNLTTVNGKVVKLVASWNVIESVIEKEKFMVTVEAGDKVTLDSDTIEVVEGAIVKVEDNKLYVDDEEIPMTVAPGYIIVPFNVQVNDNMTITFEVLPISYTLHFESSNENAIGEIEDVVLNYDESFTLPECPYSIEEVQDEEAQMIYTWEFANWSIGGELFNAGDEVSNLSEEDGAIVTVVAEWNMIETPMEKQYDNLIGYLPFTNFEEFEYSVPSGPVYTIKMTENQIAQKSMYADGLKEAGIVIGNEDLCEYASSLNELRKLIAANTVNLVPESLEEIAALPTVEEGKDGAFTIAKNELTENGHFPLAPLAFVILNTEKYKISKITTTNDLDANISDVTFQNTKEIDDTHVMYYQTAWSNINADGSYVITISNK